MLSPMPVTVNVLEYPAPGPENRDFLPFLQSSRFPLGRDPHQSANVLWLNVA